MQPDPHPSQIERGCVGGPHVRGTDESCEHCIPFETRAALDHTLAAYGRLERKHADTKRESQRTLCRLAETTAALKRVLDGERPTWVERDALRASWEYLAARDKIDRNGVVDA